MQTVLGGVKAVYAVLPIWRVYKGCFEGFGCFDGAVLLEEEFAELLAGRHDGAGSDWKFLHSVLLVCGGAHLRFSFFRSAAGLRGPGNDFLAEGAGLRGPVFVSSPVKLVFIHGELRYIFVRV